MIEEKKKVELGFCHKVHGIKGAFTFVLYNTEDSVLREGLELFLTPKNSNSSLPSEGEVFKIEKVSFGNKVICYLSGISDRNKAEEIIPFTIRVDRDHFPQASEDEVYLTDLIGFTVIDEVGKKVGQVSGITTNGVQDILEVKGREQKLDVLFIDQFVINVNLEDLEITIKTPEEI